MKRYKEGSNSLHLFKIQREWDTKRMAIKAVAGVDSGSLCTKVVIMNGERNILAYSVIRSGAVYKRAAEASLQEALGNAGLKVEELAHIVFTGYGRATVDFAGTRVTAEISCHARGANFVFPEARTVIDIGGAG